MIGPLLICGYLVLLARGTRGFCRCEAQQIRSCGFIFYLGTFLARSCPASCSLGLYWAQSLRRKHMRSEYSNIFSPPSIPSGDLLDPLTQRVDKQEREQPRVERESTSIGVEAAASACSSRALCLLVLLTLAGSGLFSLRNCSVALSFPSSSYLRCLQQTRAPESARSLWSVLAVDWRRPERVFIVSGPCASLKSTNIQDPTPRFSIVHLPGFDDLFLTLLSAPEERQVYLW